MHLRSYNSLGPAQSSFHLIQTVVAEVAHGLLNALGQGLSCALHVDCQRDPEHIPVLIVWNLDPFHELGHSPMQRTDGGRYVYLSVDSYPSLQVNPVSFLSVLLGWLFKLNKTTNLVPQLY